MTNWSQSPHLKENKLSKNELWCILHNNNHACHTCAKGSFSPFNFELWFSSYLSNFHVNCPKFYKIFTKVVVFKHNCRLIDQLLLPYEFYGCFMLGIYFLIYASWGPLSKYHLQKHIYLKTFSIKQWWSFTSVFTVW